MNNFIKLFLRISILIILPGLGFCYIISCEKATPSPYSNPGPGTPNTISPPTFSAELNNSFTPTSFTPVKTSEGSYTVLKGVSASYTITIFVPTSLSPGDYFFGQNNISVTVANGGITYVNDANVTESGSIEINSINQGKYTATFQFFAADSADRSNTISVNDGNISNM